MTWSRGLSLIIASVAVALGCTRRLSPTEQNPPVAQIVVAPETLTVDPGQQVQYVAYGRTAAGDSTAVAVTWSAAPGSISAGGLYTADTAAAGGDFQVAASNASLGLSATSHGHVRKRAVASVTVAPAAPAVQVGKTVQLGATPRDANGNPLSGRVITWSSSDTTTATVTATGLVTGVAIGAATITATCEGKTGTSAVTVTAAPPPPTDTVLLQEAFEDTAFAARGWYDTPGMATDTSQHIPGGSTRSLIVHFLAAAKTPAYGGASRHLFTPSPTVYLSYWVKYSANWVGSGHTYHPHEFQFLTTEDGSYTGPSFTHLTAYVEQNYQNGGIPKLLIQDGANVDQTKIGTDLTHITENRAAAGCNGNADLYVTNCYSNGTAYVNEKIWNAAQPYFLPNPGTGYKGDWHFVQAYFQLNSIVAGIGIPDGIVRYWFDGQLVIEHTDVLLRTGAHPTMKFNQLLIAPYIGDGSPVDQTMWVDDLTVATSHP